MATETITSVRWNVVGNKRKLRIRVTQSGGTNGNVFVGLGNTQYAQFQGVDNADNSVGVTRNSTTGVSGDDPGDDKGWLAFDGMATATYQGVAIGTG